MGTEVAAQNAATSLETAVMAHVPRIKVAVKPQTASWIFDSFAASAIGLGAAAMALALFVCFCAAAPLAAAFILLATAVMIGIFLRELAQRPQSS